MIINTNTNALIASRAYSKASEAYAQASERISTQLRVNSAKDDPVGIGMAGALKAKISSYAKAADNINSGISALPHHGAPHAAAGRLDSGGFRVARDLP